MPSSSSQQAHMSLPSIRELLPDDAFERSQLVPRSPPSRWSPLSPSPPSIALTPGQSAGPNSALRPARPSPPHIHTYPVPENCYTYPPPAPYGAAPSFRPPPPSTHDAQFCAPPSHSEHAAARRPRFQSHRPPSSSTSSGEAHSDSPRASSATLYTRTRPAAIERGERSVYYASTSPESQTASLSEYDSDSSETFSAAGPSQRSAPSPEGDDDGTKRHQCPHCGKRFNRPSSLGIHINTHTGAKPFVCPYPACGKSFNVNSNMRRHYRKHLVPPPPPGAHYHPFPPPHAPPLPPPRGTDLHIIRYQDVSPDRYVPRDVPARSERTDRNRREDWEGRARSYSWDSYGGARAGRRT